MAERNQRAFTRAYDALGCLPPDVEPRATGHVPEMIVLMRRLIDSGHAYAAGGDVYFDVMSYPDYGELSGQRLEHMRAADDVDESHKRDPRDFALWKGAKPGEPSWETPWGPGRPGWHLECSAMSTKYLGATFDIHGGGLDLVFPHHENELAQSRAAGDGFARYWVHNGLVGLAGEKMSKSLGNSLLVDAMITEVRPVELRYYLGQAHYRSEIEYSPDALAEAAAAYRRIEGFVTRAAEAGPATGPRRPVPSAAALPAGFTAAMDDDLGVPQALAVVHEAVTEGNSALAAGDVAGTAKQAADVRAMIGVLGLDPLAEPWSGAAGGRRPAAGGRRAGQGRAAAAAGGPGAQGLRRRGRDPGRAGRRRDPGRGHPARPALGAAAGERAPRPAGAGGPSPASPAPVPAATASAGSKARDRPRPRTCGPGIRRSAGGRRRPAAGLVPGSAGRPRRGPRAGGG